MGARKIGADEKNALILHALQLRIGQIEAMFDRVDPGFDDIVERISGVNVHGHGNVGAMRLIHSRPNFIH